ncbi:uncharacterized protein K02A2.6-like [Galendromus occidentalis]|uniref:RNA-directed DNA polymerase n=1 Tax=Galendromus occidentalis TaxID=34638 RepID=A0AAJ6QM85_9ACAR|nr:uncharacterized protein K02A2.6-like [Galendromus occidentalis]
MDAVPPPPFLAEPGEPQIPFDEWYQVFLAYLLAKDGENFSDLRKKATLLNALGLEGQRQFHASKNAPLSHPVSAESQQPEYDDTVQRLRDRFCKRKSKVVCRCEFFSRIQHEGESVATFVTNLRRLAARADFRHYTENQAVLDQLIARTSNSEIRERLLLEGDNLGLEDAVQMAVRLEAADVEARRLAATVQISAQVATALRDPNAINAIGRTPNTRQESRMSSQRKRSQSRAPPARPKCWNCGVEGHFAKECRRRGIRAIEEDTEAGCEESEIQQTGISASVYSVGGDHQPIMCRIRVDGSHIDFMIDSGAQVSVLNEFTYKTYLRETPLKQTNRKIWAYNRKIIETVGVTEASVDYEGRSVRGLFFVARSGANVLGVDIMRKSGMTINVREGTCHVASLRELDFESEFPEVFDDGPSNVRHFCHKVRVRPEVTPKQQRCRRLPFAIRERVRAVIDRLEQEGVIERIQASEWISPIVVAEKKNGDVRLCVDLREVNKAVVQDAFPLPHIEDLMQRLAKGRVFSKIDLRSAYHQIPLHESSRDLTAFVSPWGLFRYTRVCFGLASAPAAFQAFMEETLKDLEGVICYLDDVLVVGETRQVHDERVRGLLRTLSERGLKVNNKCVFGVEETEFLGHVVSSKGVKPLPDNVKAIENVPEPKNVSQLRSFLGMAGFYLKCVPRYAELVEPLKELLRKEVKFDWRERQRLAFRAVKGAIAEAAPLRVFDPALPLVLTTDASDYGLGAVLQQRVNGKLEPLAYASCSLSETQRRYSTSDKEALACVWAIEKWHVYLWGRRFTLKTDHRALVSLFGTKGADRRSIRLARWAERLGAYAFDVEYKPGVENVIADALSRLPEAQEGAVEVDDDGESIHEQLSVVDGILMRGEKVVLPTGLRERIIQAAHGTSHQGMARTKKAVRDWYWWPRMDAGVEHLVQLCEICGSHDKSARTERPLAQVVPPPTGPWEKIGIDVRGPHYRLPPPFRYAVVVVDYFSKWPVVRFMSEATSEKIVLFLRNVFTCEGTPKEIVSDNGPQFVSRTFDLFMKQHNIVHCRTAVYNPQANGLVERFNRVLGDMLKTAELMSMNKNNLDIVIQEMLADYRNTPHPTTGESPSVLLHSRAMRSGVQITDFHELRRIKPSGEIKSRIEENQRRRLEKENEVGHRTRQSGPSGGAVHIPNVRRKDMEREIPGGGPKE